MALSRSAKLIQRVEAAIAAAEAGAEVPLEILKIEGMSSRKVRTFLANLQSRRYMEVGTWRGSTLISACQSSELEQAVACDSFVQFEGQKAQQAFYQNAENLLTGKPWKMVEGNFYALPYNSFPDDVDVYWYDAQHSAEATRRGIVVGWPHLASSAIILIDDTNFPGVMEGTRKGLEDVGAIIHKEWFLSANGNGDTKEWWNGVYAVVVSKPVGPKVSAICLTYDMPNRFVVLNEAVESFLRQTWPNKELVIVNDAPESPIVYDHPQIKIINAAERYPSLGEKYNAGCEAASGSILMSWDDDDISLPHRMSQAVANLKDADYFNPKQYFFLLGNDIKREYKTGYAHNASAFTKEAFQKVGGYKPVNGPQDALMDEALSQSVVTKIGRDDPEETSYLYRWGDGLLHISGNEDTNTAYAKLGGRTIAGTYNLSPYWRMDYQAFTRAVTGLDQWFEKPVVATSEKKTYPEGMVTRGVEPKSAPELSICIASREDYEGLWATIQAVRLYHPEVMDRIEFCVADNGPKQSRHLESNQHITTIAGRGKYLHYTDKNGTAPAKQAAIEMAEGKAIALFDSHIMLPPGTIKWLIEDFYPNLPNDKQQDLFHGAVMSDRCLYARSGDGFDYGRSTDLVGTEYRPGWGSLMYGQWHVDVEQYKSQKDFEIWASGCGLLTCKREAWLGFSEHARGFGGEEVYIHEKFRQAGHKIWCLPRLLWIHRWGNVRGVHHNVEDRCWNYLISHYELGTPSLEEVKDNFKKHVSQSKWDHMNIEARTLVEKSKRDKALADVPANKIQVMGVDQGLLEWESLMLIDERYQCQHRLNRQGSVMCNIGCPSQQSQAVSVFTCRKLGQVTLSKRRAELPMCAGCALFTPVE